MSFFKVPALSRHDNGGLPEVHQPQCSSSEPVTGRSPSHDQRRQRGDTRKPFLIGGVGVSLPRIQEGWKETNGGPVQEKRAKSAKFGRLVVYVKLTPHSQTFTPAGRSLDLPSPCPHSTGRCKPLPQLSPLRQLDKHSPSLTQSKRSQLVPSASAGVTYSPLKSSDLRGWVVTLAP